MDAPHSLLIATADLADGLEALPEMPHVIAALATMDSAAPAFPTELRALGEREPQLAAHLVAFANRAAVGTAPPVEDLAGAIASAGSDRVAEWMAAAVTMRFFLPRNRGSQRLWHHAAQVAVAAREIARRCDGDCDALRAYMIGLLHDVGRLVMFECDPQDLGEVEYAGWDSPLRLLQAESRSRGINHAEVGASTCEAWQLPEMLRLVLHRHHDYGPVDPGLDPQAGRWLRILQQADCLSCVAIRAFCWPTDDPAAQAVRMERCCVPPHWSWKPLTGAGLLDVLEVVQLETDAGWFATWG